MTSYLNIHETPQISQLLACRTYFNFISGCKRHIRTKIGHIYCDSGFDFRSSLKYIIRSVFLCNFQAPKREKGPNSFVLVYGDNGNAFHVLTQ